VLRARVTVKLKSYEAATHQFKRLNKQSPDRTKTRTARAGDRLDLIAFSEYGDPALWPVLADANGLERPRLLQPGTLIRVPPL
jgi:nucleoid-associated protein YgaU